LAALGPLNGKRGATEYRFERSVTSYIGRLLDHCSNPPAWLHSLLVRPVHMEALNWPELDQLSPIP
jgi:hypothetical protein